MKLTITTKQHLNPSQLPASTPPPPPLPLTPIPFTSSVGSKLGRGSVSGQLVLVQSLFAQLCAPLDHVGQHFRDCVSAAEDLRDLESLKRVLQTPDRKSEHSDGEVHNKGLDAADAAATVSAVPKVYRQYGGRGAWLTSPPRMEMKNLIFSYPSTSSVSSIADTANRPILNNISFTIPPGGYSLGIVGPSGIV